jgi:hypothetical protein
MTPERALCALVASDTRYARSADSTNIAYRVLPGDGPDLLVIPGWISHVDSTYENPLSSRYHNELCRFSRVLVFDKRGTGASDRFDPKKPLRSTAVSTTSRRSLPQPKVMART